MYTAVLIIEALKGQRRKIESEEVKGENYFINYYRYTEAVKDGTQGKKKQVIVIHWSPSILADFYK